MGYIYTFLVCFFVLSNLSNSNSQGQTTNRKSKTVIAMINSSSDDAEERISTGRINLSSPDLELSSDNGKNQIIGLRFNEINVPKGAQILSAQLVFKPNESNSIWTSLIISAEDIDNALPFNETPNNISNRIQTRASVNWSSMSPWSSIDNEQTSPNIAIVIQDVVNKELWEANNSIVLLIEGSGQRTAESFDGNNNKAPTLIIEYIENDKIYTDREAKTINQIQSSTLSADRKNEKSIIE